MIARVPTQAIGNPRVTFSRLGYHIGNHNSFERRLGGGEFPRFHVYLEAGDQDTKVSLHLDAKPHTYAGFSAHVGEYEGDDVARELQRITIALGVAM